VPPPNRTGVPFTHGSVLRYLLNMRIRIAVVCVTLVGLWPLAPVGAVSLDSSVKRCLEQSIGKGATRAIERAKKLTARQSRAVAKCRSRGDAAGTAIATVLDLDPALGEADVARVRQWTSEAVRLQQDLFGFTMATFTTNVSRDPSWLANRDCQRHSGWANCVADRTELFRSTWAFAGCTPAPVNIECYQVVNLGNFVGDEHLLFKTFAHEVHHVVQDQLHRDYLATRAPSSSVRPIGPDWLLEGAAEYVGYLAASETGRTTMAASRSDWRRIASGISKPLSSFETVDGRGSVQNVYHLYALAVDELLASSGVAPKSLATYYRLLATGIGWPAAFQQAFGRTVDAFYAHFESVRPG